MPRGVYPRKKIKGAVETPPPSSLRDENVADGIVARDEVIADVTPGPRARAPQGWPKPMSMTDVRAMNRDQLNEYAERIHIRREDIQNLSDDRLRQNILAKLDEMYE